MRLRLALALTTALLAPAAWSKECPPVAQAPTPERVQEAVKQAKDRGALWSLQKDGRRSYLYGTVHIGRFEWMFPGPKLREALKSTEVLAVEVDITDPEFRPQMMAAQAQAAPLKLSEDEQRRLDAQAEAACLPRAALAALHPTMQAVTYISLAGRHDGLDPSFGQELMLLGAARAAARPVVTLESVPLQMALLMPADAALARQMLLQSIESLEKDEARTTLRRLGQAWEAGDLESIGTPEKLCQCQPSAQELAFQRQLNDDRNPHLARRIAEEHAKGKPLLAAVGLLHMTGPKALTEQLKALGFTVERVRY